MVFAYFAGLQSQPQTLANIHCRFCNRMEIRDAGEQSRPGELCCSPAFQLSPHVLSAVPDWGLQRLMIQSIWMQRLCAPPDQYSSTAKHEHARLAWGLETGFAENMIVWWGRLPAGGDRRSRELRLGHQGRTNEKAFASWLTISLQRLNSQAKVGVSFSPGLTLYSIAPLLPVPRTVFTHTNGNGLVRLSTITDFSELCDSLRWSWPRPVGLGR